MLRRRVGLLVAACVALVVLSPWLWGTGFMLHYDLVFVPHLPLSSATAGLDGGVPRAVPNDVVVALLDLCLPGWLVERLVLVGFFLLIGAGVDRWRDSLAARVVATTVLCWNPWVAERLSIGHWGYLWGYAALVWVVVGALRWRDVAVDAEPTRWASGVGTMAVGLTVGALSGSTGGVLTGLAALVLCAWPGAGRPALPRIVVGVIWWALLNAAWWFPFLTLAPSNAADARGVTAFAARAESAVGLWASLASGGGIWHSASWDASRGNGNGIVVGVTAVLAVGCVATLVRRIKAPVRWAVLATALVGVVLAGAGGVPGGASFVTWVVTSVPGGGLLRDSQKWVALWMVPVGLGAGAAVEFVRRRATGTILAPLIVVAGLVVPVATLPGLAGASAGRWTGAQYPDEFLSVAKTLSARDGGAAIFPWQLYRQYAWNSNQVVLDPWQRLLSGRVVIDDDLPLNGGVVRGESATSLAVTSALGASDMRRVMSVLREAGVQYVVEQKDQPPGVGHAPGIGRIVHDGPLLQVRDLGAAREPASTPWWAGAGLAATAAAVLVGLGAGARAARRG